MPAVRAQVVAGTIGTAHARIIADLERDLAAQPVPYSVIATTLCDCELTRIVMTPTRPPSTSAAAGACTPASTAAP